MRKVDELGNKWCYSEQVSYSRIHASEFIFVSH